MNRELTAAEPLTQADHVITPNPLSRDMLRYYQHIAQEMTEAIGDVIDTHALGHPWEICLVLSMATMGVHVALSTVEEDTP